MRWRSPRCAWHTFAMLRTQPQENDDGQRNSPRLAGNDRRHADIRDDRLVCSGVRATGARRGVLALRVRRRYVAVGLRRVRLPASGNAEPAQRFCWRCSVGWRLSATGCCCSRLYSRASIAIGTAVYNVQPFMLVGLAALFLGEKLPCRSCSGWRFRSWACWRSSAPMARKARRVTIT